MRYAVGYFSGTGNTLDTVRQLKDVLEAAGNSCSLVDFEAGDRSDSRVDADHLVLAFPVYSWMPPALVMRAIRTLPAGGGTPASVVAVDGGGGARAALTARRALRRRGYDVRLSTRVGYPDNWSQMIPPKSGEEAAASIESGRRAARSVAADILSGHDYHYSPAGVGARIQGAVGLLFRVLGRRLLGQLYIADSRCTSCRICERSCPVGAISMDGGKPRWSAGCESCNRCINVCPERAINTSWARAVLMVPVVVVLSIVLVRVFDATAGQAIAAAGLGTAFRLGRPVFVFGLVILAHVGYFLFNRLFFIVEHAKPFQAVTYASFTAKTGRYTLPGFNPPIRRR